MFCIPDDPVISCMQRTGFPPWMNPDYEDGEEEFEEYEEEDENDDF